MKFIRSNGKVITIKGDQQVARRYYNISVLAPKDSSKKRTREPSKEAHNINLTSINPRLEDNTEDLTQPQPDGEFILIQLG